MIKNRPRLLVMLHGRPAGDPTIRRSPLPTRVRRVVEGVITLSLALGIAGCGGSNETPQTTVVSPTGPAATTRASDADDGPVTGFVEEAEVVEVIDGDTLRVRIDGQTDLVRLTGIDTPEVSGPYRDEGCFGDAASDLAAGLVPAGSVVALERDTSDRDQYDRLLRYVWTVDEAGEWTFINEALVTMGAAEAKAYPPDTLYASRLDDAESLARARGSGMWSECRTGQADAVDGTVRPMLALAPGTIGVIRRDHAWVVVT